MSSPVPLSAIAPDIVDPYKDYKVASPKIIHGENGLPDVLVYNVRTDFRGIDKVHKASFIPRSKVKSSYARYVPDIGDLPKPGATFDEQERQRIIDEGVIPEILPFMTGARIALAERRAKRQHKKAQSAAQRARVSRRVHVAHNAAEYIVKNGDYTDPKNEFPPTTLLELAMAKRMGRLLSRGKFYNAYANAVEDMYTPPGKYKADFDGDPERQSIFEQLQRRSSRNLHKSRVEKADRQLVGRRIPFVGKRVGLFSFEGLAAGGPGSPVKKSRKALKKRDEAVLKAEALRRAQASKSSVERFEEPTREHTTIPTSDTANTTGQHQRVEEQALTMEHKLRKKKSMKERVQKTPEELGDTYFASLGELARLKADPNSSAEDIKAADEKAKAAFEDMYRADITRNISRPH